MAAISVRLPVDLSIRLEKLAAKSGRSKTYYIREALTEHISDLELYYIVDKQATDLREGRIKASSIEDVERRLGLVD